MTAMLEHLDKVINSDHARPVYLIGASMGGQVALHYMNKFSEKSKSLVKKILLLAPSFDFMDNRTRQLGESGLADWRKRGFLPWTHLDHQKDYNLHYGLVEDMLKYEKFPTNIQVPTFVIHGYKDKHVDHRQSIIFHQNTELTHLRLVDSDHSLKSALPEVWRTMFDFFDLANLVVDATKFHILRLEPGSIDYSIELNECLNILESSYGERFIPREVHLDRIAREKRSVYSVMDNTTGEIIGCTIVNRVGKRCAIGVKSGHRGMGVGPLLVCSSLLEIRNQYTEIAESNKKMASILGACGFTYCRDEAELRNLLALSGSVPDLGAITNDSYSYSRLSNSRTQLRHEFILLVKGDPLEQAVSRFKANIIS